MLNLKSPRWHLLEPLSELNANDLELVLSKSEIAELEPRTLMTAEPEQLIYLLEGEVSILAGGFVTETFTQLDRRALSPLFNESLDEDSAVLTSHATVLYVERELFEGLYVQSQAKSVESSEIDLSEAENELFLSLLKAFEMKKLDMPSLPEAAMRIRQAINQPEVGSSEIIQIVQSDPVLSARLVKVSNSPLYGTWREIKTVRDAVRRLGLETTKNLSFSLSVKKMFTANTSLAKNYIHKIYNESTAISSISYVIAQQQAPHLDPEQALLSGLIQNLGVIPILKYLDEHPAMIQSAEMLGKSISNLKIPISTLILNEWNFDPEFMEIIEQSENWQRDTGQQADYCDVVIAARLIYLQDQKQLPVDNLERLPVILKLGLMEHEGEGNYFMKKAEHEIEEMQKLLHTV